ncbi:lipopolysaccharide biosynthesis protein [Cohaesibacter gelatinilyticus]|uniref:Membrane protein involved in the export of O-antigen and teichoic acid n=1 Tax=Cohaesibacter gelatinilyticus TaxID=372072 RepID=A0A285PJJ5_9HYPH|nr:oligosaccharide flippase family protein [Cohaesibacter gelatinilyticus]SNZ21588.1 Membrane protein involved in the export of O-antigen and teichoic acid [Cohaesibacter gelatinilyticus]
MTLKKNFIWMLLSQGVFSGLQWLLVILLARGGGAEHVGQYGLALALTTPVQIFFNLSLRTVYVTYRGEDHSFGTFWRLRLLSLIPATFLIIALAFIFGDGPQVRLVILLVAIAKMAEASSDMLYALPQRVNQMDKVGKSMMVRAIISTALFALLYWTSQDIVLSLACYAAGWVGVLLFFDRLVMAAPYRDKNAERHGLSGSALFSLAKHAMPIGLASFATAIAINIPRLMLEQSAGTAELGIFAALTYFILLGSMVVNVLGQAVRSPLATAYEQANGKRFWAIIGTGSCIAIGMGIIFWLGTLIIGEWVLRVVYGSEFAVHSTLFCTIGLISMPVFLGTFLGFCLPSAGSYQLCLYAALFSLIASFGASMILVPVQGAEGAAWAYGWFGCAASLQMLLLIRQWLKRASMKNRSVSNR